LLNTLAVKAYGESEFWLSGGKVILIFILFFFAFITMVGGNPQHDAYGFRYWSKPGSFAEHLATGPLGRFEGFLAALWGASFCIVGPEYISMTAGEAERPRVYIKNAFKTIYWRFGIFFVGGALACSVVIPYNDPTLAGILSGEGEGAGTANASPYVIAMKNLGIEGLPHVVNALLATSIFSAGNTLTYCASRSLYSLALDGQAPGILRKCTVGGVPIYSLGVVMLFPCLSFLQIGSSSSVVLQWLVLNLGF
jgi:amino acid transporter